MLAPAPAAHPLGRRPRLWLVAVATLALAALAAVMPLAVPASAETPETPEATAYDDVIDITFPVDPAKVTFADWYDAGRVGHVHQATDIMGSKLLPIYAAMGGKVTRMPLVDDQYGYRLTVAGDDGRSYSYVHLNNDTPGTDDGQGTPGQAYAPGVELGGRVERGQHIAFMGDSGNAEATQAHLHFSIADPAITDPYGTHIRNPYKSLRAAIERGDIPTEPAAPVGPSAPPPPPPPAPPSLATLCGNTMSAQSFSDVSTTNVHSQAVGCLADLEVTFGVGDGLYAPSDSVTRLQMASFTARLLEAGGVDLPQDPPDAFDDDAGTVHEKAVNQLVALKIIRGDTGEVGRDFQGRVAMKRDRMAAWMTRAYALIAGHELPASTTDHFSDDSALHHADINRLADAGIVQGTRPGIYSPRNSVRRDQMASYLARTLAYAEST